MLIDTVLCYVHTPKTECKVSSYWCCVNDHLDKLLITQYCVTPKYTCQLIMLIIKKTRPRCLSCVNCNSHFTAAGLLPAGTTVWVEIEIEIWQLAAASEFAAYLTILERARERKSEGAKERGSERARERKSEGAKER